MLENSAKPTPLPPDSGGAGHLKTMLTNYTRFEKSERAALRAARTFADRARLLGKLKDVSFKIASRKNGEQDQIRLAIHYRDSGYKVVAALKKARSVIGWETDGRQACDSLDALIYRECGRADADYEKFLAGATLQRQAVILLEIEQAELIARLAEKRYTS